MLYDDKAPEIMKEYKIKAFPTFIILNSEGEELGRPRNMPRNLEGAKEWFPKAADAFKNLATYEAAHADKPDDVAAAKKLAEVYGVVGKGDKAIEVFEAIYEKNADDDELTREFADLCLENRNGTKAAELFKKLIDKAEEGDEGVIDLKISYGEALMGTLTRANQAEEAPKIVEIYADFLPGLVKAGDERAIDPSVFCAKVKAFVNKDNEGALKTLTDLYKPFEKSERLLEIKYQKAILTYQTGDAETAKAELKEISEADAENAWAKRAKSTLDSLNKRK
ncbi:MAG: tetratricopeptide repeat protein [Planctomycetota bacterium]|jgi:predicted Zn-dependent protease